MAPLVQQYFEHQRPTHVVHLAAACGGIGANIEQPAHFLHANTVMGLNLLEASRLLDVQKFLLVSTTCAYPQDAAMPLQEKTLWDGLPTGATRAYGLAKRFLHEAIYQYERQYGLRGAVLIPANLYGPGDHYDERSQALGRMIKRFVNAQARDLPSVENWGTGEATREFLHVRDAARAIQLAINGLNHCEPVNIGTGVETSIRSLAELIADLVDYKGLIHWDTSKPNGQPRRCLDTEAATAFGFKATIDLRSGLTLSFRSIAAVHWLKPCFR